MLALQFLEELPSVVLGDHVVVQAVEDEGREGDVGGLGDFYAG